MNRDEAVDRSLKCNYCGLSGTQRADNGPLRSTTTVDPIDVEKRRRSLLCRSQSKLDSGVFGLARLERRMAASIIGCSDGSVASVMRQDATVAPFAGLGRSTIMRDGDTTTCTSRKRPDGACRSVSFSDELVIILIPSRQDDDWLGPAPWDFDQLVLPPHKAAKPDPKEAAKLKAKLFSVMGRFKKPAPCITPDHCRRSASVAA